MSNNKHHKPAARTPTPVEAVAAAEAVISGLEHKRQMLTARAAEHAKARERLSYLAHVGLDPEASKELAEARAHALDAERELTEVDSALTTAKHKFAEAQAAMALDERKALIKQERERVREYAQLGPFLDRALDHLQRGLAALSKDAACVGKDHRHIFATHRVIAVALDQTVFKGVFPVPDSGDKRSFPSFSHVIGQWTNNHDANLKRELEMLDAKKTEAA
jgi:hypothetical protein